MPDFLIYHNPACSKSRHVLSLLEERGVAPEVVCYLESPPSAGELAALLKKLGIGARDLLRKGEDEYEALGLSNENLPESELIAAMVAHPILIERPIVVKGAVAIIGRPPERVLQLL